MTGPKIVAVLGGGISGLSAAYYIRKKFGDAIKPVIFEKSSRCGGWVESVRVNGIYYDTGPRSFRPVGLSGLNALDFVEEIGIDKHVLYVPKSHPAYRNRCIFTKGKLVRLPTDFSIFFKTTPPFERPLLFGVLKDLVTRRYKGEDDSIYNFIERRFGSDIAAYGIDPLIRGVCAGDAKKISVNFSMGKMFEYEQKYGSVGLGTLISRVFNTNSSIDDFLEIPGHEAFGMSNIACTSIRESWALWGLENGAQTLIDRLEEILEKEMDVHIIRDANVDSIQFPEASTTSDDSSNSVFIHYSNEEKVEGSHPCDYIVSALPSWTLGNILLRSKPSFTSLWQLLKSIEGVDVVVTSVLYHDPDVLLEEGFGFLVPSNEIQNTAGIEGLLGVVFDTCTFYQGENTILTVISKHSSTADGDSSTPPTPAEIEKLVKDYLRITLGITRNPDHVNIKYSSQCIPQYTVGHSEKIEAAKRFIKAVKIPLILSGASFEGVSVNDCIYSGRRASENLPF